MPGPDPFREIGVADDQPQEPVVGPLTWAAGCWIGGVLLGSWFGPVWLWFALAVAAAAGMMAQSLRRKPRGVRAWALLALVPLAAAWTVVRQEHLPADHIAGYLQDKGQLALFRGRIIGPATISHPQGGAFAQFSYQPPATFFILELETMVVDDDWRPVSGRLLAKVPQADHRLRDGVAVQAAGWFSGVEGPGNPGEEDFRPAFELQGVSGRLTLEGRENCRILDGPAAGGPGWRASLAEAAADSLTLGLDPHPQRLAFLKAILLGRWSRDLVALEESFRRTGLAHILSISGAHLAILLGLVWLLVRTVCGHPRVTALAVLAVLALYLAMLPWQVPIVRAAVMAALFCLGYASGRRMRAIDLVALAAWGLLIWRPGDLFNAGFQLSFGITAALILFTQPVSRWLRRGLEGPGLDAAPSAAVLPWWHWPLRRASEYLAANLVGFLVALPVVSYHFGLISPLAIVLSILALPAVTAVLAVGYLKILLGLVLPSLGIMLSGPLEWVADAMTGLTESASHWRGAAIQLTQTPSAAWTVATTVVVLVLLAGGFARRRLAAGAALGLCAAWLALPAPAVGLSRLLTGPPAAERALRLNALSVGDGSCLLIRIPGQAASEEDYVAMFDCGSQAYLDVGLRSIAPALRRMGVARIDTLLISHADLDHFCAVLDLADRVTIARVVTSPHLLRKAQEEPGSTSAFLVRELRRRHVPIESVEQGWSQTWGRAEVQALWPPADCPLERENDLSLVLSLRFAGRRVLLTGDIQDQATEALLAGGLDLRADVMDLPHHGSFGGQSPRLLAAVRPTTVLQSCGPARLREDPWPAVLDPMGARRHITAKSGMIEVSLRNSGETAVTAFRERPAGAP